MPINIPADSDYDVEVLVSARQAGSELARLEVLVESDTESSIGASRIRQQLVELHDKLLGVRANVNSLEIAAAYELFVKIWQSDRDSSGADFDIRCDWESDQYYLDGIVEGAWLDPEIGEEWDWDRHGWDHERLEAYFETIDATDPHHVARTWVAMLAYMLTDYRYLFL